jgi:hypothetical protein
MQELNVKGTVITKNDQGFNEAIMATLFNKVDPRKRPFLMVKPRDVEDIIETIRYAKSAGRTISICSGGHSWSANHLREGSILINMSGFNTYQINKEAMTAKVGPGVIGSKWLNELFRQGLFFPASHCKGVCVGGYLLQGGFGWNSRKLGLACENVIGIDVVTADGAYIHASETENSDLFWAARGAGSGFFGVVVCFHLKLFKRPEYCGSITHVYDIKHLEEVYRWAYEVGPSVPEAVEFQLLMSRSVLKFFGTGIEVAAPIFADSKDELEEAKAFMHNSPIKKKAFVRTPFVATGMEAMHRFVMGHFPENQYWGVDNMWTSATIDELLPYLQGMAKNLPPAPSHVLWLNWHPGVRKQDMAFSLEDKIYISLFSGWTSHADSKKYEKWATDWMKWTSHLSSGIQLADENLHNRTAPFLANDHLQKLDKIRAVRDSGQLFNTWHSRPQG